MHTITTTMLRKGESGVALVAVLWTLTLLSIVAASLSVEGRTEARVSRNMVDNAAARATANAGINRAILDLLATRRDPAAKSQFRADGTPKTWTFAQNLMQISVQNELGKINLNLASETLLNSLFQLAGVKSAAAAALANAVVDYRGSQPRGLQDAKYRSSRLAWGSKRAPFETVEELQQVVGMTPQIYERVMPYITIYSNAGIIHPTWASAELRRIANQSGVNLEALPDTPETAYSIRAEAVTPNGAVFVREAVVQLIPESGAPIRILAWR